MCVGWADKHTYTCIYRVSQKSEPTNIFPTTDQPNSLKTFSG